MSSLAVKYRPKKWEDVYGQDEIVSILKKQIETNTIKNTYIFSGTTGSGKTTSARIFANEVNKGLGSPIEIDGASNNGVDNVRQLISTASERSLDSEYKIIILDEAHMLSNSAWNAFLKTVEEPPKYTIFIFCTTDPQKIPDTIKNRCMRFNFTRIPAKLIMDRLIEICKHEGLRGNIGPGPDLVDNTLDYISRISHGEMRNAISMLEKCADFAKPLSVKNAVKALGNFSYKIYFSLVNAIVDGNQKEVLTIINEIYNEGYDLRLFVTEFLNFLLDVLKYILTEDVANTKMPKTVEKDLKFAIGFNDSTKYYNYYIDKVLELKNMLRNDSMPKQTIEVMFSKMCRLV